MKTKRIIAIVTAIITVMTLSACSEKESAVNGESNDSSYTSAATTTSSSTVSSNNSSVNEPDSSYTSVDTTSSSAISSNKNDVGGQNSSAISSSTNSSIISSSSTVPVSPSTTMSSVASTTELNTSVPVESTPIISTSTENNESKPIEQEWTETKLEKKEKRYVNQNNVNSRVKPITGSNVVKTYNLNDCVTIVASTNMDYYKLDDNSFIHKSYLSQNKIETTSNGEQIDYNRHINDTLYSAEGVEEGIKITKPIPTNLDKDQLDYIYDRFNDSNVYRELWNLNVGDITSNGNKIIGKTPEGFGYINSCDCGELDCEEWGQYIGDIKNGEKYYISDYKIRRKKMNEVLNQAFGN